MGKDGQGNRHDAGIEKRAAVTKITRANRQDAATAAKETASPPVFVDEQQIMHRLLGSFALNDSHDKIAREVSIVYPPKKMQSGNQPEAIVHYNKLFKPVGLVLTLKADTQTLEHTYENPFHKKQETAKTSPTQNKPATDLSNDVKLSYNSGGNETRTMLIELSPRLFMELCASWGYDPKRKLSREMLDGWDEIYRKMHHPALG